MAHIIDWLKTRLGIEEPEQEEPLWDSGVHVRPSLKPRHKPVRKAVPREEDVDFLSDVGGKVVDGGPGKNVLIRNKYVREDTGTHETLKIVDDSLLETDDESGEDPYNTGRFDRSTSWDSFRKRK